MSDWLADTSVAIPLVQAAHSAHRRVNEVVADRLVGLAAHAALETYSVLTRLPGDARLAPSDAATLIEDRFDRILALPPADEIDLVSQLARAGIMGGAVYDAVIALTALNHEATLLTRDSRAAATYAALRTSVELVD